MKPVLIAGITLVNIALASYSIAIITQNRKRKMSRTVLTFLSIGVFFDITATICMIIGSGHFLTVHGVIGYSSLIGMLTDTILSFRLVSKNGLDFSIPAKFNRISTSVYIYWVLAYITGAVLVMVR
ncbi:MAG: hypothetical protein IPH88_03555 [Bacteroidales bacterium]|nr:hypothetical protein [Bacteroidales bacterium]